MLWPYIPPQALERELAPVEGRLAKLNELAKTVITSNPAAAREVKGRQAEIADLWDKLKVCVCVYSIVFAQSMHFLTAKGCKSKEPVR